MGLLVFWVFLSAVAGTIAGNKGRDSVGFFLLSIVLSPIIGILAALIAKPNFQRLEKLKIKSGENKRCPNCAELIKKEAMVCRYCSRDIPNDIVVPEPPEKTALYVKVMATLLIGFLVIRLFDLIFFDGNTTAIR